MDAGEVREQGKDAALKLCRAFSFFCPAGRRVGPSGGAEAETRFSLLHTPERHSQRQLLNPLTVLTTFPRLFRPNLLCGRRKTRILLQQEMITAAVTRKEKT